MKAASEHSFQALEDTDRIEALGSASIETKNSKRLAVLARLHFIMLSVGWTLNKALPLSDSHYEGIV
jgi:hypothetical protein